MNFQGIICTFTTLGLAASVLGQAGDGKDKQGTVQKNLFPHLKVPPAPVLSAEEAVKKFTPVSYTHLTLPTTPYV